MIARVPRNPRRQSVRTSRSENSNCDQNIGVVWARTKESKRFNYKRITPALTHIVFRYSFKLKTFACDRTACLTAACVGIFKADISSFVRSFVILIFLFSSVYRIVLMTPYTIWPVCKFVYWLCVFTSFDRSVYCVVQKIDPYTFWCIAKSRSLSHISSGKWTNDVALCV